MQNILIAAGGGLAINLVNLMEWALTPKPKRRELDWAYIISWIGWPLLGAFLVYVYEGTNGPMTTVGALYVGVSAPFLIKSISRSTQNSIDPGPGA